MKCKDFSSDSYGKVHPPLHSRFRKTARIFSCEMLMERSLDTTIDMNTEKQSQMTHQPRGLLPLAPQPLVHWSPMRNERLYVANDFTTDDIRNDWREPRICVLCDEPIDCIQREIDSGQREEHGKIVLFNCMHFDVTATQCKQCGSWRHGGIHGRWSKRYGAFVGPKWHRSCKGGSNAVAQKTGNCSTCVRMGERRTERK